MTRARLTLAIVLGMAPWTHSLAPVFAEGAPGVDSAEGATISALGLVADRKLRAANEIRPRLMRFEGDSSRKSVGKATTEPETAQVVLNYVGETVPQPGAALAAVAGVLHDAAFNLRMEHGQQMRRAKSMDAGAAEVENQQAGDKHKQQPDDQAAGTTNCGDGVVDDDEECDGTVGSVGCSAECTANQECSASAFNDDALCSAADSSKPIYDGSTPCLQAVCFVTDCCKAAAATCVAFNCVPDSDTPVHKGGAVSCGGATCDVTTCCEAASTGQHAVQILLKVFTSGVAHSHSADTALASWKVKMADGTEVWIPAAGTVFQMNEQTVTASADGVQLPEAETVYDVVEMAFALPSWPEDLKLTGSGQDAWGYKKIEITSISESRTWVILHEPTVSSELANGITKYWLDAGGVEGRTSSIYKVPPSHGLHHSHHNSGPVDFQLQVFSGDLNHSHSASTATAQFLMRHTSNGSPVWLPHPATQLPQAQANGDVVTMNFTLPGWPRELKLVASGQDGWGFTKIMIVSAGWHYHVLEPPTPSSPGCTYEKDIIEQGSNISRCLHGCCDYGDNKYWVDVHESARTQNIYDIPHEGVQAPSFLAVISKPLTVEAEGSDAESMGSNAQALAPDSLADEGDAAALDQHALADVDATAATLQDTHGVIASAADATASAAHASADAGDPIAVMGGANADTEARSEHT